MRLTLLCALLPLAALCAAAADAAKKPNIIFIMADDLNADYKQDRHRIMHNLNKRFVQNGLEFVNHVATAPVCGPSRSSTLVGRYPHNTGYVANNGKSSVAAFSKLQNDTVGQWLTSEGYHTAFLGKYVNGMEGDAVSGFRHWGGLTSNSWRDHQGRHQPLGGTYNYMNASQWVVNYDSTGKHAQAPRDVKIWDGVHQASFLANGTLEQAAVAKKNGVPFFISVTPVMVHWGSCQGPQPEDKYSPDDPHFEWNLIDPDKDASGKPKGKISMPISACPKPEHRQAFAGHTNPHVPSWNQSESGTVPDWIKTRGDMHTGGCCDNFEASRQDMGFRNRSASLIDLDDMIGDIFDGLEAMGELDNTYIFFTGDNGYHLGEHHLLFGKSEPYDTDIRVPMYVRGPNVPAGGTRAHPSNHLDITATIVELAGAGAHVAHPLDGKSFASVMRADAPSVADWRPYSFSEFFVGNNTWAALRFINSSSGLPEFKLVWWCSDQSEVFRLDRDPWELINEAGDAPTAYGKDVLDQWLPTIVGMLQCAGEECQTPERPTPPSHPLPCHNDDLPADPFALLLD